MITSGTRSKSKKNSEVKDSVKRKRIKVSTPSLSEEAIRRKANEIYLQQMERGESGTAENDWIKAEILLESSAL
jgi:hypothetical protein